jgi:ParB-like chromosome segregation protein Spo0J
MARTERKAFEASSSPKQRIGAPKLTTIAIGDIVPDPRNPRKHSRDQVRAIARSIEAFGFNTPILMDTHSKIIAGHGRFEAAKLLGKNEVPVIRLAHLTDAQARAYMLADNKLSDRSSWDEASLAQNLKELSELVLDFDFEAIGFEPPEVDFRIQSLDSSDIIDRADEFESLPGPAVSIPGELWRLGKHRLCCGSALDPSAYEALLTGERAGGGVRGSPLQRQDRRERMR